MRALRLAILALLLLGAAAAWVAWRNVAGEAPVLPRPADVPSRDPALIERGAYLALAGNCAGCHTDRGGRPYAGGRAIETPFGTVHASNLTPDAATGLGRWSASEFWRAMHHGRSRDGRLLYPAFPYPNFTRLGRDDSDALFAFLQGLPAVEQPHRAPALRFPYDRQVALAVWRALYFTPHSAPAAASRGEYLVEGLGHCRACHGARNPLGAPLERGGAIVTAQNWYAPSLGAADEGGVAAWSEDEVVALLASGISARGSALGPMAAVVFQSTQHLRPDDLRAMARYLRSLPQDARRDAPPAEPAPADTMAQGAELYKTHCADCHGERGEGRIGQAPALAGNRSVTMGNGHNLIQVLRHGGFTPATAANPQPYGMPPFGPLLDDVEIAALATFVRQSWGQRAPTVRPLDVMRTH